MQRWRRVSYLPEQQACDIGPLILRQRHGRRLHGAAHLAHGVAAEARLDAHSGPVQRGAALKAAALQELRQVRPQRAARRLRRRAAGGLVPPHGGAGRGRACGCAARICASGRAALLRSPLRRSGARRRTPRPSTARCCALRC